MKSILSIVVLHSTYVEFEGSKKAARACMEHKMSKMPIKVCIQNNKKSFHNYLQSTSRFFFDLDWKLWWISFRGINCKFTYKSVFHLALKFSQIFTTFSGFSQLSSQCLSFSTSTFTQCSLFLNILSQLFARICFLHQSMLFSLIRFWSSKMAMTFLRVLWKTIFIDIHGSSDRIHICTI